jgi:hypothetical protein
MRRDSEIEQNGVYFRDLEVREYRVQISKRFLDQRDPISKGLESLLRLANGFTIEIETDQAPIRRRALENRRRMSAAPHCSIHHDCARLQFQGGQTLLQERGPVRKLVSRRRGRHWDYAAG